MLSTGKGYFYGHGKKSVAQAFSVGFSENQARAKSLASENGD
jgi:hypothetical protein